MKNYTITVNGVPYSVTVEENNSDAPQTAAPVQQSAPAPAAAPAPAPAADSGSVTVEAPMPGNIIDIKTSVGQTVASGDVLIILEAMKMENNIVAPSTGTVASINVNKGDSVEAGQVLITMN